MNPFSFQVTAVCYLCIFSEHFLFNLSMSILDSLHVMHISNNINFYTKLSEFYLAFTLLGLILAGYSCQFFLFDSAAGYWFYISD